MGKRLVCRFRTFAIVIVLSYNLTEGNGLVKKKDIESSLEDIHDVSIASLGDLCLMDQFKSLSVPLDTSRFDSIRQKADLSGTLLQDLGVAHHNGLQDAISKNLIIADKSVLSARILAINASTGSLINCAWWQRQGLDIGEPKKLTEFGMELGYRPNTKYPWYEDADSSPTVRSPKFIESPPNVAYKGWWTYPYFSCLNRKWLISYSVPIPPPGRRGIVRNPKQEYYMNDVKLLAPITKPDKILGLASNYRDDCMKRNVPFPKEPMVFTKFASGIVGPYDDIPKSSSTNAMDWEVELVAIIGKKAQHIKAENAMDYIFGYTITQDLTAKDWVVRNGGQLVMCKAFDGFCPLGPWIVTKDELCDPYDVKLKTWVNGELKQDGHSSNMLHRIDKIVEYLTRLKGFLSLDVDVSHLEINQCERKNYYLNNEISIFHGSHKCHNETTQCIYSPTLNKESWTRGKYQCVCRPGFFSEYHHGVFNGTLVEIAWSEYVRNSSNSWEIIFQCKKCAPGCHYCRDLSPCLATYHWPFRITLLSYSIICVVCTIFLIIYMYKHRKLKVFKVSSPIFLSITLLGCATMYLEMAAIFPLLDQYSCIATKWSRHLGFCVTYTALLMKTWRVSLTYRVKSAHKVKLTDKQLLQWMVPILLVMLIYLGTWTLSDTPNAEDILDNNGLKFKQCVYNWWDHSLAIGEVLFLAWGIRVCYNVRNAESHYNEAKLISYAIYNIAIVNIMMIAFHLFIFPRAGPDIKYLLGFIRTQLSTSTTIALVFGPKVIRVLKGQGDQWDSRARSRGVTASFSLNGIGLVPEETPDLFQENEELKEEIQKLAAQIEFMKIVHMESNNRHVKPKSGGYFSAQNAPNIVHSPLTKGYILGQPTKPPDEL